MLSGYKTYVVAALMAVHSISGFFLGNGASDINLHELLLSLGLAALRNAVPAK